MSVRELNQQTSAVLREVEAGHTVTIVKDGRPVARLVPLTSGSPGLDQMIADGRVIPPALPGRPPRPPVSGDPSTDVAAHLVAMRDEERY